MSYKKIVIIAVFFITHVMLCNSTYCQPRTLDEIKNDACPTGKFKMKKILKDKAKFRWMKPNDKVLVFPEQKGFPEPELADIMYDKNTKDYACDLLRLIPPVARTKDFLKLYQEAILTVKGSATKVTTPMVYQAFKAFEGCCLPLPMGKTEIPSNYFDLHSLITDPKKHEAPQIEDLPTPGL